MTLHACRSAGSYLQAISVLSRLQATGLCTAIAPAWRVADMPLCVVHSPPLPNLQSFRSPTAARLLSA